MKLTHRFRIGKIVSIALDRSFPSSVKEFGEKCKLHKLKYFATVWTSCCSAIFSNQPFLISPNDGILEIELNEFESEFR